MAGPIAPISPMVAVPPVQPSHNVAAVAHVATNSNVGTINVTTAVQAAALQNTEQLMSIGQTSANQVSTANSGNVLDNAVLANLSPQALTVLSAANTVDTTGGNLTTTQLEELAILKNDALMLNMDQGSNVSLLNAAGTMSLSPQAVNILNAFGVNTGVSIGGTLTPAQAQQMANILAPFMNEPLTSEILAQMQSALAAAGFSPAQLSLQNMFLAMRYVAEIAPVSTADELTLNEILTSAVLEA